MAKAVWSVVVGGGIAVVLFIPFLIWQFRRYGAMSAKRMLWNVAGVVYATAVVAYTLFPLPDMSGDFCARPRHLTVLDPTVPFRELAAATGGLAATATSWTLWQMLFNVALFVPLGVLLRRFLCWRPWAAVAGGAAVSGLVELTQYTANWGLVACRYRVTDTNDLLTNTVGGALGVALTALLPRFESSPDFLRARRHLARPVTKVRRLTGMLLDLVYFGVVAGFLYTLMIAAVLVLGDGQLRYPSFETWQVLVAVSLLVVGAAGFALLLVPTLSGDGASLGQRTVYLRPMRVDPGGTGQPEQPSRGRLLARAMAVHGLGLAALTVLPLPVAGLLSIWFGAALAWAIFDTDGLSARVSGLRFVDARATAPAPPRRETATAYAPTGA